MFVVWALARPEWHGSCTISHRFDSWKGPWQDGRGRSSDSICMHLPCFQFRLVSGGGVFLFVIVITSIAAQHFGMFLQNWFYGSHGFPMNHKAGYMLPFLGALGTFELYDSWMANWQTCFFNFSALRSSKLESLIESTLHCTFYGHFTPDFDPSEALYLTFNGWEKAVTFHWFGIMLERWLLFQITKKISNGKAQFVTSLG